MKKKFLNLIFIYAIYLFLSSCGLEQGYINGFKSEFACPPDELILEDLGFTETWHKEQENTQFYYVLDPYDQVISLDFPSTFMLTDFNLITCLKNLQRLKIEDQNQLKITENIGNLNELEELYLDNNSLQTLPKNIAKLQRLKILSLKNNHFKTLPDLSALKELNFVVLSENPWSEEFLAKISDYFSVHTKVILE